MVNAEKLQQRFTATSKYNLWPQAKLHTQWPGVSHAYFYYYSFDLKVIK